MLNCQSVQDTQILRVAAYVRVSTDLAEQTTSFEAQRDYYEKKNKENPEWVLAGIYADEGKSGTSYIHRAEFNRMMEGLQTRKDTANTMYYHKHWETWSVAKAVESIKGHDAYVIEHGETIRWIK